MLISCSKSCRTQAQLTGGQAEAGRALPALKTMLSFFCRSSCSLPPTLLCRLSGEETENTFSSVKENKVSGILRKLLKQKLSTLHASSAVCICQLLCTALLETFQMHVLTNNPGQTTDEYPSPVISHGQSCGFVVCPLDSGLNH